MKNKIIYILIFVLNTTVSHGQDDDYAYLIETLITGALHANNNSMSISTDKGFVGSTNYAATTSTSGNTYYDFFYLQDTFTKATIKVNNYAIRLGAFPDCDYMRELEVERADFGEVFRVFSGCSFRQRVYTLHTYPDTDALNNGICLTKDIRLEYGYDWQFELDSRGWVDFPAEYNQKIINVLKVGDLLQKSGINLATLNATTIKFRTGYNGKFTNIVPYSLIDCSPKLKEPIATKKTNCNYSKDGSFKMIFERDLRPDEKEMVITLYDANNDAVFAQDAPSSLVNEGGGHYSYTWSSDLDAGNYRVKYQTHNATGGISDTDNSWDSLEFSQIFIIDKASKLILPNPTFTPETCFQGNDGYIDISATGESGRTFFYQLKENSVPQVFNGTNWTTFTGSNMDDSWIPFTNSNNSKINTLGKGNYSVQVRDSKKCYSR